MESNFPIMMESTGRSDQDDLGASQMVIQQYARYPPTLESTLRSASSLGSARSQADANKSPSLHRKETPRSIQSSPRGFRSVIPPSVNRSGPSMSPPVFDATSIRHPQLKETADQAESRSLPSREITDETIDDAYVSFILYCNPNVPSSVDSSELRQTFRCPPRSDGKSFSIFTLFELIRKLDNKELKTWIQLAIELGVEPPSMEKKQSTQKVQQYAVRLKRWMRAMHVDAFFEFCLGHQHQYYTQLPSGPYVGESRDGVPLEEDLALRALVPQWKPKRGRKRAEDRELEEDKAIKRPQLDTSVAGLQPAGFPHHSVTFPQSAIPFSAFPNEDPWITASSAYSQAGQTDHPGQDLRWRLPERETSPAGYPQSAIIPRGNQPSDALVSTEPRSAITPSAGEKGRSRRRHGPAVSSAWSNSNASSNGKSRGRPPSKPSTSGPFSTFHVNSTGSSHLSSNSLHQPSPLVIEQGSSEPMPNSSFDQSPTPINNGRPSKLQLQVPQHFGAPVRLATPPTLLVNGVNGAMLHTDESHASDAANSASIERGNSSSEITMDSIVRALADDLMRARLTGRVETLKPDEAHKLALAFATNISSIYSRMPFESPALHIASYFGVSHHFGFATSRPTLVALDIKTSPQLNNSSTSSGHDETNSQYILSLEYSPSLRLSIQLGPENLHLGATAPVAHVHETAAPDYDLDDLDLGDADIDHSESASEATWKSRYMKLRAQMQKKERALSHYKRKIVESVMADI